MLQKSNLYVLVRLWIEMTRQLGEFDAPSRFRGRFGLRAHDMLISGAVYLAMTENRQMTATKLADFVGLPRVTVLRRLRVLERDGIVERRGMTWRTAPSKLARVERKDLNPIVDLVKVHAKVLMENELSTAPSKVDS